MESDEDEDDNIHKISEDDFEDVIEEQEYDIYGINEYIIQLQDDLNYLFLKMNKDNINLKEFQNEILKKQSQIAQARVELIKNVANVEELKTIKKELEKLVKDKETPPMISDYDKQRKYLTHYRANIQYKIDKLFERLESLKIEQEKEQETPFKSTKYKVQDISWFENRLPNTPEEKEQVIQYFRMMFGNINNGDLVQLFGSVDQAKEFYTNIDTVDMSKLQKYYSHLVAVVDTNYELIKGKLDLLRGQELLEYKNRILKTKKFNKKEVDIDFDIIINGASDEDIYTYMKRNNIPDKDIALDSMQRSILLKYNTYFDKLGGGINTIPSRIPFEFKETLDVPVREVQEIDDDGDDLLYKSKNILEIKKALGKLPKRSLIECIRNISGYDNPYIKALYRKGINIIKFKTTPNDEVSLARELGITLEELHIYKFNKSKKYVLIDFENYNNIPDKLFTFGDEGQLDPVVVSEFFKNIGDYNAQLVYPASNEIYEKLKNVGYSDLSEALENTKMYGFFKLKKKALLDIGDSVPNSFIIKAENGIYPTFQKIPVNNNVPKSFIVNNNRIVLESPPAEVVKGWLIFGDTNNPTVIDNFEQYLELLRKIFISRIDRYTPKMQQVTLKKIKTIDTYLGISGNYDIEVVESIREKDNKYRKKSIINTYKRIVKEAVPLGVTNKTLIKLLRDIEKVIASLYININNNKLQYSNKLEELIFIVKTHPNIFQQLLAGNIQPSDVINIKSSFNPRKLKYTYEELIKWKPPHELLSKYPEIKKHIEKEIEKEDPNPVVIPPEDIPQLENKAIISQSYEYILWHKIVKEAKRKIISGLSVDKVTNWLLKEKESLPSSKIKHITNIGTRMSNIEKLNKKFGKDIGERIEFIVYKLSDSPSSYMEMIGNIFENTSTSVIDEISKLGKVGINDGYKLMTLLSIIPHNKLRDLPNPVLGALFSYMHTYSDNYEDIEKIGKVIKNKQNTHMQLVNRLVNNKPDVKLEYSDDWRDTLYTPSMFVEKIPINTKLKILPLPNKKGYLIGGKYPTDPKEYRYYRGFNDSTRKLKSHLPQILSYFMDSKEITYQSNDIDQNITPLEQRMYDNLSIILDRRFSIKNDYSYEELKDICKHSGYTVGNDMYSRCIVDNLDNHVDVQIMSLGEYKKYILNKVAKGDLLIGGKKVDTVDDSYIIKLYYAMKGNVVSNKYVPYLIEDTDTIYKVKYDKSTQFPVPSGHIGTYPVYFKQQFDDLSILLQSGKLSPWLSSKVYPIYQEKVTPLVVGSYVLANGKNERTKRHVTNLFGIVKDLSNMIIIEYFNPITKKRDIGEFALSSVKQVDNGIITGFTGTAPFYSVWFDDDVMEDETKYQKLVDIYKNINNKSLISTKYVLDKLTSLQKDINDTNVTGDKISQIVSKFKLLDPLLLKHKIMQKYNKLYEYFNIINNPKYITYTPKQKQDLLQQIKDVLGYKEPLVDIPSRLGQDVIVVDRDICSVGVNIYNNLKTWERVVNKYGIDTERITVDSIKLKLSEISKKLLNDIGYLNDLDFKYQSNKQEILKNILNYYSLGLPDVDDSKISDILNRTYIVSNYYIEKEFTDRFDKKIIVREGVSKSNISWKPVDWDPCNEFTDSEINFHIINTINFLKSDQHKNYPILDDIKRDWELPRRFTKESLQDNIDDIIKTLKNKLKSNADMTRCDSTLSEKAPSLRVTGSRHNLICRWDVSTNKCVNVNIKPNAKPIDKKLALLQQHGTIEQLPKVNYMQKDPVKFKESVWEYEPEENKERWDKEVKDSLKTLQKVIRGRVRVSSRSYKKKYNDITKHLEKFRRSYVKSKGAYKPPKAKLNKEDIYKQSVSINVSRREAEFGVERYIRYGILCVTPGARKLIDMVNGKERSDYDFIKTYTRNENVHRNANVVNLPNRHVYISDILKNMNYTRRLNFPKNISRTQMGPIYDLLEYIYNKKEKITCVQLTELDVLDYLGDSYMQFVPYKFGYTTENNENTYISPGCVYTNDVSNPFITYNRELDEDNNYIISDAVDDIYVIDQKLHRKNALSNNPARRLAMILGTRINFIPPCFSSKPNEKEMRKEHAITENDVHTYFLRNGKPYDLDELNIEDIKDPKQKRKLEYKLFKRKEMLQNYKRGLKEIINNDTDIHYIKKVATSLGLDLDILTNSLKELSAIEDKNAYIRNFVIPNTTTNYNKQLFKDIDAQLNQNFNISIKDYISGTNKRILLKDNIVYKSPRKEFKRPKQRSIKKTPKQRSIKKTPPPPPPPSFLLPR